MVGSRRCLSCGHLGQVILFLTDGEDCTMRGVPCSMPTPEDLTPVDAVMDFVEKKQQELIEAGSQPAHIFSFSLGFDADDEIPKEMACANEGVWSDIRCKAFVSHFFGVAVYATTFISFAGLGLFFYLNLSLSFIYKLLWVVAVCSQEGALQLCQIAMDALYWLFWAQTTNAPIYVHDVTIELMANW